MNTINNSREVRQEQGFAVYVLNNGQVEVAVVPELGARIISLKNLETGREWMWHPQGGLKLFRNSPGDDFSKSPLVGTDECLPTIAPCTWQGRHLPDHGEVWSVGWGVDQNAWKDGVLKTSARLDISPFDFTRVIELHGGEVRLGYTLANRNKTEERYLWAIHPLIRLQAGDRVEVPAHTRERLDGEAGIIDALDSAIPVGDSLKVFASPLNEGQAAICNEQTGDRLEFEWDPDENDTLGVWLTRGGWHGHHHFALEPMNGDHDELASVADRKRCGVVAGNGSIGWQVTLRIATDH